ncbi:hypothetical protein PAN31117_03050 [Pandoraea anapnoica]|uniref:Ner winged helix-turn-helix DNA-binding domain-containing protein n=1 Tax=Pandoraea anapnoica TaxID=2508301 RepID=A0A5E5A8C8_9BURK|nr:hypothetical protein PAN31117_03050 [Pandoraea anapnoica]
MGTCHDDGWHKEDIKAAIRKKGINMTKLAKMFGIPPSNVRNACVRPVASGEKAISAFIQVPLYVLWPDRWTPEGQRIRPRYAHKYIGAARFSRKKCKANGGDRK